MSQKKLLQKKVIKGREDGCRKAKEQRKEEKEGETNDSYFFLLRFESAMKVLIPPLLKITSKILTLSSPNHTSLFIIIILIRTSLLL